MGIESAIGRKEQVLKFDIQPADNGSLSHRRIKGQQPAWVFIRTYRSIQEGSHKLLHFAQVSHGVAHQQHDDLHRTDSAHRDF